MQEMEPARRTKKNMELLYLGIFGLGLLLLYDLASLKKMKKRCVLAASGYLTHAMAVFFAIFRERSLNLPNWAAWPGFVLTVAGLWWLTYCLFLFPPIKKTYHDKKELAFVAEGPYAFSRHPGFLGYTILLSGLVLASRSFYLLEAAPIWTFSNLFYIYIQDRWIFPRIFPGYNEYRQKTPMLIPNRESMRRFWKTFTPFRSYRAHKGG
ncbi:MAG: methyltransferase family protein [Desulfotomaculales bacterium]